MVNLLIKFVFRTQAKFDLLIIIFTLLYTLTTIDINLYPFLFSITLSGYLSLLYYKFLTKNQLSYFLLFPTTQYLSLKTEGIKAISIFSIVFLILASILEFIIHFHFQLILSYMVGVISFIISSLSCKLKYEKRNKHLGEIISHKNLLLILLSSTIFVSICWYLLQRILL